MGKKKKSLAEVYDAENERVAKLAAGVQAHEYYASFTGMCCGAMVMRDGGGDQCGLPYGHALHIGPKEARVAAEKVGPAVPDAATAAKLEAGAAAALAEPKKPLAEIRERDFVYAREVLSGVPMATALLNSVTALYNKAAADGYTPADVTLAIKISPTLPSRLGVPQTRIVARVTGWKAVEL